MDQLLNEFQILYGEIKTYDDIRYNLEVERYKNGVSPNISFTQKTFKWSNPKYELDDDVSIQNTKTEMKQYICDVQNIIKDIKIKLI
jgi:hypothetical protein